MPERSLATETLGTSCVYIATGTHTLLTAAGRAADDRDEHGTTVKVEMWRLTSKVIGGLDSDTQPACRYKQALSMFDLAIYQWPGRVDPMPTSSLSSLSVADENLLRDHEPGIASRNDHMRAA